MPDFAPDFTPRYRVRYISAGINHVAMLRGYRGEPSADTSNRARTVLAGVFDTFESVLPDDFAWLSAEYIPEDTNIGSPDAVPATVVGLADAALFSTQDRISSLGFVGRSASTPVRLFMFGVQVTPDVASPSTLDDWRLTSAESAGVAAAVALLNSSAIPANNNMPASWALYANLKVNDYWLKRARRGSL